MAFSARAPDPNILVGKIEHYRAGTVADVDFALTKLRALMRMVDNPHTMAAYLNDRDLLLDRRNAMVAAETPR